MTQNLPKRKLNLKVETLRPLQADELESAHGGSTKSIAESAAASALTGGAVSAFISESATACSVVSAVTSAIGGGVSQLFGCW